MFVYQIMMMMIFGQMMMGGDENQNCFYFKLATTWKQKTASGVHSRRIYRGAVNLFLFRHCPSKIFWKCTIWNINIQYKNDWYTLQKLTKPVFAFRHWENLVSSSIYPSCVALDSLIFVSFSYYRSLSTFKQEGYI